MDIQLNIWVTESGEILSKSSQYLEQLQQVDLQLLSVLPEIDDFIQQITDFLHEMIDDILSFIDQIIEGLDWLLPEINKMQAVIGLLLASARTFTGLLQASLSINTSTGSNLMNFSAHAGFAGKMEEALDVVEEFKNNYLPGESMIEELKGELVKAKNVLKNVQSNLGS